MHTMPSTGARVVDPDGQHVGTVSDIYADPRTLEPQWAVVTFGLFHNKHRVVPTAYLHPAADRPDELLVDMNREACRHAPEVGSHEPLTPELERRLQDYYGLSA